ncbi:hypothetical protein AWC22_19975 [Mycobacterium riyadhense]|uniref:Uncharacterized protein n=1 Tax=Mycobacterium riyadhense TaxID=486698 RepID=A0A1X2CR32_9MYCO|nr:hypothetical protein [Mycobacterium riyadhense]ORW78428.1 hypothetical protein AWC22_19975 [Mycobacterium riyadhense]
MLIQLNQLSGALSDVNRECFRLGLPGGYGGRATRRAIGNRKVFAYSKSGSLGVLDGVPQPRPCSIQVGRANPGYFGRVI